ncbi:hypothetical protein N7495_007831 [Penicillium taxi]|uniref:uncharacterized protein n=1 Tax=Penicillium taxi TaxID=168475 RepID=UPI0025452490|nr:uncharacterized protein N7495_007831 [Penicillium taxi]KAJ5887790.1 hypothetical protein N7495_007831 [Penicillium taxi]
MNGLITIKFAIGQRAFFLKTPHQNILWDLIAFLDDDTVEKIQALGGLSAMVISHPHYYTTYVTWARTFKCPVYVSPEDTEWMSRMDATDVKRELITETTKLIVPGLTAIKCGGHFPGSLVLHWAEYQGMLFIADTIVTVPSGLNPSPRLPSQSTYTFMWSIPNMIPMPADDIYLIWKAIRPYKFRKTFGAFNGLTVETGWQKIGGAVVLEGGLEQRILDSMKIVVRGQLGMSHHPIFEQTVSV